MNDPGFEIYAGSFNVIRSACADDFLFEKLRRGEVTNYFVHFPPEVTPGDVVHLHQALTKAMLEPVEFDIDREELDNGIFIDKLSPIWVKAVAFIPESESVDLQEHWKQCFFEEEERQPEWAAIDQTNILKKMLQICRTAVAKQYDVVMVWLL